MEIEIRLMIEDDFPSVMSLQSRTSIEAERLSSGTFQFSPSSEENIAFLSQFIEAEHARATVALSGESVVGYMIAYPKDVSNEPIGRIPATLWVDDISVAADYRGKGIGRVLLNDCCEFAKIHGFEEVWLSVFSFNVRAQGFYVRHGFEAWSTVMRKKVAEGVDSLKDR